MNQLFLIGFVTLFTALTAWSGEAEFDHKKLMKSMMQMNEQVMKVKSWRDTVALGYSIDDYFKMAKTAAGYETLDSTFPSINNESLRTIEKLREAAIAEGEDSSTFLMWENDMLYIMLSDNFLTAYRDKPNFIKLYLERLKVSKFLIKKYYELFDEKYSNISLLISSDVDKNEKKYDHKIAQHIRMQPLYRTVRVTTSKRLIDFVKKSRTTNSVIDEKSVIKDLSDVGFTKEQIDDACKPDKQE